jgi:hypothetical protein
MLRRLRGSGGDLLAVHPERCRVHRAINRQGIARLAAGGESPWLPVSRQSFELTVEHHRC